MIQPTLEVISSSRDYIDTFGGYNRNIKISENEFFDMKNMTSDRYPVLSPRNKRGVYEYPEGIAEHNPQGLISKDSLCYVDGRYFVINNYRIDMNLSEEPDMCPKQLISMGAYVIIMPDKKYINTLTDDDGNRDFGPIEAEYNSSDYEATVTFSLCKADGSAYENYSCSESAPENPENMQLWVDMSQTPHTLMQYEESSDMWVQIATTYIRISAPHIAADFERYDGIKISGIDSSLTELNALEEQVSVLWDVHKSTDGAGDYLVVIGMLNQVATQTDNLKIAREMPDLDFVIESNNRLWGCRYGTDNDGSIINEIYASKAADFKNWNCFMGLSTDSYSASCGTDGRWTGAINYLGYPTFFKENHIHKVYGNYPANYQIQTTACRGVQKGAGNSLAILNEVLFYKSRGGVCAYNGSLPSEISRSFGDIRYSGVDEAMDGLWDELRGGAVAGAHNNKYYISQKSEIDGKWYLFVYDSSVGLWHKEDETRVAAFCSCRGEMYFISDGTIHTVSGSGTEESEPIEWMAESGNIGMSLPDKKYLSRILFRLSLAVGSRIDFFVEYDTSGIWEKVFSGVGTHLRSFSTPIKPKRCDHFKIRIEGVGEAKIFSIVKTIEQGSDL